jgi:hypothetical protein
MESEKELRALFRTVDVSASAKDGDIAAGATVTWSR